MKYYLCSSLLENLLVSPKKKVLADDLEDLLHSGNRFYTSVHSLLHLRQALVLVSSDKWRIILHLVDELVEEILPLDKKVLEMLTERESRAEQVSVEATVAVLCGMDQLLVYGESDINSPFLLPLRNLFRKAK